MFLIRSARYLQEDEAHTYDPFTMNQSTAGAAGAAVC